MRSLAHIYLLTYSPCSLLCTYGNFDTIKYPTAAEFYKGYKNSETVDETYISMIWVPNKKASELYIDGASEFGFSDTIQMVDFEDHAQIIFEFATIVRASFKLKESLRRISELAIKLNVKAKTQSITS